MMAYLKATKSALKVSTNLLDSQKLALKESHTNWNFSFAMTTK